MTAGTYELEPVAALGPEAAGAVARIYTDGFPHRLRVPFQQFTERLEPGELALALVRAGQPAGFAVLRSLGDTSWTYLRYFVVDQQVRGQGIGGILWGRLLARLRDDGSTLIVFDVEDPAETGCPPAETQLRSRRISFYERHGARVLPVLGYRAPHPAAEDEDEDPGWTPMLLMAAATRSDQSPPGDDLVPGIVTAVYQHRWRLKPDDPRIAAALAGSAP